MDDIVIQSMARWPNVPHCFGWLRLDARGAWRMRDERAQQLDLAGERIAHVALLAFINRNYTHDEQGRWYFQNGPQRVFVDLELTPFIVHTQPPEDTGEPTLMLHTGAALTDIDGAAIDQNGRLYLRCGIQSCAVDDRDMEQLLPSFRVAGEQDDDALLRWIEGHDHGGNSGNSGGSNVSVSIELAGVTHPVARIDSRQVAQHFGFVARPR